MNSAPQSALRSLIAQGVIGLAVCIGGYAALVMPMRERLIAARAEVAAAEAQAAEARAIEGALASVMDRLAEAGRQAEVIRTGGAMARSQDALFASVNATAAKLGLRIDEFAPVASGPAAGSAPAGEVVLRCRFAATGTFVQIVHLLRSIGRDSGFATIRAVRLSPLQEPGSRMVLAEVQTEHYAVDPGARMPMTAGPVAGAAGGQP
jgi:hypothetical protein